MKKTKKKRPSVIKRVEIPVLITEDERTFLRHLSHRNHLTLSEMFASVMRRHIKLRYRVDRKEWYYVFGK